MPLPRITLQSCPKRYTTDLDKAVSPQETVDKVTERLASLDLDIFRETFPRRGRDPRFPRPL